MVYLEPGDEAGVLLHHQQVCSPRVQDGARQPAGTRAHFADVGPLQITRLPHDFVCNDR